MKLDFSKLFFMDTPEEHQVLLTKEDLPEGPSLKTRIEFSTGPEVKTETFPSPLERDAAFKAFLLADAKQFFERVSSFRTNFYSEKPEVFHEPN